MATLLPRPATATLQEPERSSPSPSAQGGNAASSTELPGKFGLGWNGAAAAFFEPASAQLGATPLTVELWFKAEPGAVEHVFAANGLQTSGDHWSVGARRETGYLFCHFAASRPATFETRIPVADSQWHYVALILDERRIRLFLDDRYVVDEMVASSGAPVQAAALSLATRLDEKRLTALELDDVRITARCRDIVAAPELPLIRDDGTLHLWDFEASHADYLAQWTPGGETNQRHLPYPHQIAEYELEGEKDWEDGRWQDTVKGPVVSHTFLVDGHEMGAKQSAVFLDQATTLVFDERACAFTAVLTGSQMKVNAGRAGLLYKPGLTGQVVSHVSPRKTWLRRGDGPEWIPLETDELDYRGYRLHDHEILFEYRVGATAVQEHGTNQPVAGCNTLLRRWRLDEVGEPLRLTLAERVEGIKTAADGSLSGLRGGTLLRWSLGPNTSASVALAHRDQDVVLELQPGPGPVAVELAVAINPDAQFDNAAAAGALAGLPGLDELQQPGGRRWGEPLETAGTLGVDDGKVPYVIDELTVPLVNPFQALMFISGFDFFTDGKAAVCTAHGDVWVVTGIDDGLSRLRWQRFATGLYQPLGLKIVDGQIVVICRNQLTRLEDVNADGEADIHHSLCHELSTRGGDHAYAMRLESDRAGNLYFLKSSEGPPHGCSLLRWNRASGHLEVVARGFRHPYGLGIGPNDELTVADNEGQFIPSSKIDLIRPGGFYGYFENKAEDQGDVQPDRPLCFIPKFIDNSCGGQLWVPDQRWGSYHAGEMLHLSWGRCTLHAVLRQQVGEVWQAATVRFPGLVFRSGSGTGRFHPRDGQLYVVGLDGWQTGAVQDGCFSRVRHTGRTPVMPESFAVYPNGIRVRYTVDLAAEPNLDPARFPVEHWNYLWSSEYGSFHYRPSSPKEIGHDRLAVNKVSRLDDRTLFLHIDDLKPVDQIQVTAQVVTATGEEVAHQLLGTINALPEPLQVAEREARPAVLFSSGNLVAWCIVPFDAAKRGPADRAAMLQQLGITKFAYDWRDEHVPHWDEEVAALKSHHIELAAFWAPVQSAEPLEEDHWRRILELIDRHGLTMQLWVMLNESLVAELPAGDRPGRAAAILQPLAAELARRNCQLAIYNHGGWCGEPENMVRIVESLKSLGAANAGIVYNLHHGHEHLPKLAAHLQQMRDHLLCLNLNGMRPGGPKILPVGSGDDDGVILAAIEQSGYRGLIGILGHREELDAAISLRENLDGLRRLRQEAAGKDDAESIPTIWSQLGLPEPNPDAPCGQPRDLEPLFADDFATDQRDEYQLESTSGTITWQPGALKLDKDSSLECGTGADDWIEVAADFRFDGLAADDSSSVLKFALDFGENGGTHVLLRQHRIHGQTRASIELHDLTDIANVGPDSTLVAERSLDGPLPDGRWRFSFCGGVWRVVSPVGETVLTACVDTEVAAIGAFSISTAGSPVTVNRLEVRGRRPAAPGLTPTARREMQRAEALHDEVYDLMAAGRAAEALPVALKSVGIRLRRQGLYHPMTAIGINNLASVLNGLGRGAEAERLLLEVLPVQQRLFPGDHPDVARCLNNLAHVTEALGRAGEAEPRFEQALAMYRAVLPATNAEISTALNNLAHVRKSLGRTVAAEALFVEALEMSRKIFSGDHPHVAGCLNNLALVREQLGRAAEAEQLHEQALAMRQRLFPGDHPGVAGSLAGLASARAALGELEEAEPLYRQAVEMNRRMFPGDHPLVATSLNNLAAALGLLGRFGEAEPLYTEALEMRRRLFPADHPDLSLSLNSLGRHWLDAGDSARAEPFLLEAATRAASYLERSALALSENQQLAMQSQFGFVLESLMTTAVEQGEADPAVFARALGWKGAVFRRQQLARLARGAAAGELRYRFDQLRRVTAQLTHASLNPPRGVQLEAWRQQLAGLESARVQLERDLASASAEFRQFRAESGFGLDELRGLLPDDAALVDLQTYRRRTGEVGKHGLPLRRPALCAIIYRNSASPRLVELGFPDELDGLVDAWREQLIQPAGQGGQPDRELRRLLWEPLVPHLEGCSTVLISPAGSTALIPWGALPGSTPDHFLLEEYAIGVVPVPQALAALRIAEPGGAEASLLVVADVNYGASPGAQPAASASRGLPVGAVERDGTRRSWAELPAASAEATAVATAFAQRFPDAPVDTLRGGEATEQRVQAEAERHAFLHLVTHGYFAPRPLVEAQSQWSPDGDLALGNLSVSSEALRGLPVLDPHLLSGLVLAGANQIPGEGDDDGYLLAADVATLDLSHARLVTLSACETGLGALASGEGVLGLQRAFQVAGAETTVTSLWKVDDAATQVLMARFYANLWGTPGVTRLEALREAQLWMIRHPAELEKLGVARTPRGGEDILDPAPSSTISHPYFWAAWTLAGDWR